MNKMCRKRTKEWTEPNDLIKIQGRGRKGYCEGTRYWVSGELTGFMQLYVSLLSGCKEWIHGWVWLKGLSDPWLTVWLGKSTRWILAA